MRKNIVGLIMVVLCSFTSNALAYSGNLEDVTLSVTVERKVSPDIAYVNYSVVGRGRTSKLAAEESARKIYGINKILLKNDVSRDMVEQMRYDINPIFNEKNRIIGYEAVNVLKVRVEELSRLGDIVDVLSACGADNVGDINYSLKNREIYQDALLQDAMNKAKNKARVIAVAGGRNIGRLLNVRINSYTAIPRNNNGLMFKTASANADGISTVIESREIELRADVETTFALE